MGGLLCSMKLPQRLRTCACSSAMRSAHWCQNCGFRMPCPVICYQTRPANPGFLCFSDALRISPCCKFMSRMTFMSSKQQRAVKGKAHKVSRKDGWTALSWDDLSEWAGSRSVDRGRTYQKQGRVHDLAIS